ncbi:amidophosphoribosyltransferase [bacterium]|nr:amidophosphoribosyltransferase [bacterium]
MCGIFALTQHREAAHIAFLGLFALQHRGQESAGLATLNQGHISVHRDIGLVSDIFTAETLARLPGTAALGHVRYSTAGGDARGNIQPLAARVNGINVALAHNGNLVNAPELRDDLERRGAIFQGTADTEIILHLLAQAPGADLGAKMKHVSGLLEGAFTLVLMTPTHLYACVDALGYRPLSLARLNSELDSDAQPSWVVASETCAFELVNGKFERDILPGEMVEIELATGKLTSHTLPDRHGADKAQARRCVFEQIYFARPDSQLWGQSTFLFRETLGAKLAEQAPVDADLVIPIPDSGVPMAMGYARASKIPYAIGLIRNHYVGRTFIEPTQTIRNFRLRLKLSPLRQIIEGKRLVVVDDSIVRGTTSRRIVELLREAGALEVHMRIGSPPVKFPCFYGIDTPKRRELLAQQMNMSEMRETLHVDSLAYLNIDTLHQMAAPQQRSANGQSGFCDSCFSGCYSDKFAQRRLREEHAQPSGVQS